MNDAIEDAINKHKEHSEKPYAIIMDSVKGAGVDFMEDDYHWHYGALDDDRANKCYQSLDRYYASRVERAEKEG